MHSLPATAGVGKTLTCTVTAAHRLACTVNGSHTLTSEAGRVLLSSSAALLMCLFLSPRFIEFLRDHGLGKNIREEGPEGHKVKAGTPIMGGIIIMILVRGAVPVPVHARLGVDGRVRRNRRLRAAWLCR